MEKNNDDYSNPYEPQLLTPAEIEYAFEEEKSKHLKISIGIDVIGMLGTSFMGEALDIIYAPISAIAIFSMYRLRTISATFGSIGGLIEELLPKTDIIPSASFMWLYFYQLRGEDTLKKFAKRKNKEQLIIQRMLDPNYQPEPNYVRMGLIAASLFFLLLSSLYYFKPNLFTFRSDKSAWVQEGLKGEVKFYTTMNYVPANKFGDWVQGERVTPHNVGTTMFDEQGRRQATIAKTGDAKDVVRIMSKYEDDEDEYLETERTVKLNNQMIEVTEYHWAEDDTLKFENYDATGKLVKKGYELRSIETQNDTTIFTSIARTYTGNNKIDLTQQTRALYNDDGDKILEEYLTSNAETKDTTITFYQYECGERDEIGNCIRIIVFEGDDKKKPKHIEVRSFDYH